MYYPMMLNVKNKACVIIGGGSVAFRKSKEILACEAQLTVVSPKLCKGFEELYRAGSINWIEASYDKKYLQGAFICFACTNNEAINARVLVEAGELGILSNAASGDILNITASFIVPAVRRKGSVAIAVSCEGNPGASRYLADLLNNSVEQWLVEYIEAVRKIRDQAKLEIQDEGIRQNFIRKLYSPDLLEIAEENLEKALAGAYKLMAEVKGERSE